MSEIKLAFKTFGCRANAVDTEILWAEAHRRGFKIVKDDEYADAYVINSCTVTAAADKDTRYQARRYRRLNPKSIVGVVGCYAQVAPEELESMDAIDFVVGSSNKEKILGMIQAAFAKEDIKKLAVKLNVEKATGFLVPQFQGSRKARASLKIQDGCNFACTFCIIPQARGRSRSLPLDTIVQQAKEAHAQGFREVVLTGIHIAHYGWDQGTNLMALVKALCEIENGPRVRLSTLDPFEIPDEMIELSGRGTLCPYFHIALQSGSDTVLGRMRRIYKAQEFYDVCEKIRTKSPQAFITVDVIAGFPGETDAEFEETFTLLRKSHWSKLHAFPYSARKNTPAAEMNNPVPPQIIKERMNRLMALSEERQAAFLESQRGQIRPVVVERVEEDHWVGHTDNYIPVRVSGNAKKREILSVRLGGNDERVSSRPQGASLGLLEGHQVNL